MLVRLDRRQPAGGDGAVEPGARGGCVPLPGGGRCGSGSCGESERDRPEREPERTASS